jgi:predicted RNA-binding protein (virulence factor B family)
VPRVEPHSLSRGQAARFRVSNVLPDGRIELSLRGYAHQELASDGKRILALLSRGEAPRIGDRSSPEEIRRLLGLSKKAFKRAAGRLLKEGAVSLDGEGFLTRAR